MSVARGQPSSGSKAGGGPSKRFSWDWVGLAPFFAFAIMFLFLPSVSIFIRSFEAPGGGFTISNLVALVTQRDLINAYKTSLSISLITATGGSLVAPPN